MLVIINSDLALWGSSGPDQDHRNSLKPLKDPTRNRTESKHIKRALTLYFPLIETRGCDGLMKQHKALVVAPLGSRAHDDPLHTEHFSLLSCNETKQRKSSSIKHLTFFLSLIILFGSAPNDQTPKYVRALFLEKLLKMWKNAQISQR